MLGIYQESAVIADKQVHFAIAAGCCKFQAGEQVTVERLIPFYLKIFAAYFAMQLTVFAP